MAIEWNEHRFSGGALALDMVNTVIYREMPDRRLDRFADRREIPRFAEAAARFRAEELGGTALIPPGDEAEAGKFLSLREAINALFREAATKDVVGAGRLTAFLSHGAALTDRRPTWRSPQAGRYGRDKPCRLVRRHFYPACGSSSRSACRASASVPIVIGSMSTTAATAAVAGAT
ncbi:hypothetical protein PPNSA23_45960 [Phyllobacterium phragmitis]|uniref:Uncharacterized protein n=1 Tax=Phyllobacterium phragmitis TaxID=2670329 RepID=A0ABQ0H6V1_9HYPH